jgi:hypothetical protein
VMSIFLAVMSRNLPTNNVQSNLCATATLGTQKKWPKVKANRSLFTVYFYKIAISFGKLGLKLAVVDRWPLFRGGR